jgi:hypothetical protein
MYHVLICFSSHTEIIYLFIYFCWYSGCEHRALLHYFASILPLETLSQLQYFIKVVNYIITFCLYAGCQVFLKCMFKLFSEHIKSFYKYTKCIANNNVQLHGRASTLL